jgi:hypothetical protein
MTDNAIEARFNSSRYGNVESATTPATFQYINESGLPDDLFRAATRANGEIANAIEKWSASLRDSGGRSSYDLFNRTKWTNAKHTFATMSKCAWAVENDDVLSTLADVTEGLAFNKVRFELYDSDQEDVWNQWARDIDLDSKLRQQFRELFKVSQVYIGLWWENRTYQVRDESVNRTLRDLRQQMLTKQAELRGQEAPELKGPGKGNRTRRKSFSVKIPTNMTIFDPTKILPVGSLMFGRERYAYIANRAEAEAFDKALAGQIRDRTVVQLLEGRYEPTDQDKVACAEVGASSANLYLFRPEAIFRHALTMSDYERFSPVRLKSILQILEMKEHLRNSDRASLIGNTNFIVVIKKGTDKLPAKAAEIENLQEQAKIVARLPVLVGDHRLSVEIVSPALDNTLIESRWQVLDSRLVFRALQTFTPLVQGGNSSGSGVSEMSRIVSRGLENRRHMLVRTIEAKIFRVVVEENPGVLTEMPSLAFTPRRISLDFDADIVSALLKLRDRGDISRETTLEELEFDQDIEALRRARERVEVDDIFQSQTPFSSPNQNPYQGKEGEGEEQSPPPGAPKDGTDPEGGRPRGVTEDGPRAKRGRGQS